jgi:hypothetical protein
MTQIKRRRIPAGAGRALDVRQGASSARMLRLPAGARAARRAAPARQSEERHPARGTGRQTPLEKRERHEQQENKRRQRRKRPAAGQPKDTAVRQVDDKQPSAAEPEPVVCRTCGAVHSAREVAMASAPGAAGDQARAVPGLPAGPGRRSGGRPDPRRQLRPVARGGARPPDPVSGGTAEAARPQSRIVRIRRMLDRIDVSTTDTHLPLRIGEAVVEAHGGTLHSPGRRMAVRYASGG